MLTRIGLSLASILAALAGSDGTAKQRHLPRLTPDLAEDWAGPLDSARGATAIYVLGRDAGSGFGPGYRLHITDGKLVQRLVAALQRSANLEKGAAPDARPAPYTLLFLGKRSEDWAKLGLLYDLDGSIFLNSFSAPTHRATEEFRRLLNPLIEDRRSLLEIRDRFLDAVADGRWSEVEITATPELSEELRESVVPWLMGEGVVECLSGVSEWRDSGGVRKQYRKRGGLFGHGEVVPMSGFVGRLRCGDRGPSRWVHVLLSRGEEGWRVENLKVRRSGSRHGGRH